jgi:hypothetical protein
MTDTQNIVKVVVDCHSYAWHLEDPDYAECGPDNLVRMAEQFGVMVEHLADDDPDNIAPGWAWWYRITGPRDNVVRLLADEYAECISQAEEMVDGNVGAYVPIGFNRFTGIMYGQTDG